MFVPPAPKLCFLRHAPEKNNSATQNAPSLSQIQLFLLAPTEAREFGPPVNFRTKKEERKEKPPSLVPENCFLLKKKGGAYLAKKNVGKD